MSSQPQPLMVPQQSPLEEGTQRPAEAHRDKIIVFGTLSTLVCLGGFFLWAFFVPLTEGVLAIGTVVLDSNRKAIQHLEGGIVKQIHVRNGDSVAAGEVLVELEPTQIEAELNLLQTRRDGLQVLINRLHAERLEQKEISFDSSITERLESNHVQELINSQTDLFNARNEQYEGQHQILLQRVEQLREQRNGIESQIASTADEEALLQDDLRTLEELRKDQLADQSQLNNKNRELSQLQGRIGSLKAELARINVEIGETQEQIIQVKRSRSQEVSDELSEAQEQLYTIDEQISAKADVFKRTQIVAPQNGTVMNLSIHTVGGVVRAASPILEIIPDNDRLVLDGRITANDIDNVRQGQKTRVRFSAFRMRTTPTLDGTVERVSADVNIDEVTGQPYYSVRVLVAAFELAKMDEVVLPGMPVEMLIRGGEKTAIEYLLDPILSTLDRALIEE